MMITNRIFKNDPYLKSLESSVLSSNCDDKIAKLTLRATIFFPTGGGQSCDKGFIKFNENKYPVIDVYEEDDEIIHVISKDNPASLWPQKNSEVLLEIDWEHRFDNMQRHCGEHILSGVIHKLFNGANKGFHMGEEYITIDIDFSASDSYSKLTWEMAEKAEFEANKVIWQGSPVHANFFDNPEDASKLPLRKPLAFDEDISIVTIGNTSAPDDCVACCGTHPDSASEVGLIKIYKIEPNKGMTRIYFEAGKRAFSNYQSQFNTIYAMSLKLSTGTSDILNAYESQISHTNELRNKLSVFRDIAINHEVQNIMAEIPEEKPIHDEATVEFVNSVSVFSYTDYSIDDILNIAKKLSQINKSNNILKNNLVIMVCTHENTVILVSDGNNDDCNCSKLAKIASEKFDGKGGGRPTTARIHFSEKDALDSFIQYIS